MLNRLICAIIGHDWRVDGRGDVALLKCNRCGKEKWHGL